MEYEDRRGNQEPNRDVGEEFIVTKTWLVAARMNYLEGLVDILSRLPSSIPSHTCQNSSEARGKNADGDLERVRRLAVKLGERLIKVADPLNKL